MCSVGGLIRSPGFSPELIRKIILNLLPPMIERGSDASGIAVFKSPEEVWIKKEPIPSTWFAKKLEKVRGWEQGLIFLLHARAWTTCPPSNNYCNHPVFEVINDRLVALVHNGIVYDEVELEQRKLEVDSDALLNPVRRRGRLDDEAVEEITTIRANMAILISDGEKLYTYRNYNPLCYAELDGAIVFASTCSMVKEALERSGLTEYADKAREQKSYVIRRFTIKGDKIESVSIAPEKPYLYGYYSYTYKKLSH